MLIRSAANREGSSFPAGTPLDMIIVAWFHRPKSVSKRRTLPVVKPDLDNIAKLVMDSLSGVVYPDDSQICRLTARKAYCKDGNSPCIHVWLYEMKSEE
jgi:Holliday junction resolvase RusA-like endonuclease